MLKRKGIISILSLLIIGIASLVILWNPGGDKTTKSSSNLVGIPTKAIKQMTGKDEKEKENGDKPNQEVVENRDEKDDKESNVDKDENKDNKDKETVTEKKDGTTVKVAQSTDKTPTATVKVEKSNGGNTEQKKVATTPKPTPQKEVQKPAPKPVAPTYLSASQAKGILGGALKSSGNEYYMADDFGTIVSVKVGSNHVSSVYYNATKYQSFKMTH